MVILRDGRAKVTGLVITGQELQRVTDSKILKSIRSYTIASIKKEYGGGYSFSGSAIAIERVINFLSME